MKRKLLVMILSVVITGSTLAGCGSDNTKVESGSEVSSVVEEATEVTEDSEDTTEEATEESTEEVTEVVKGTESTETTEKADKEDTTKVSTKDTNTEAVKTEGTTTKKDTKPSTTETKKDTSSSTASTSGGTAPATHEHTWVPVTKTVHHDAVTYQEDQGHYETVVVEEAHDEPVMESDSICITCYYNHGGKIVRLHSQEEVDNHSIYHVETLGESCQYGDVTFQAGTKHVDAVTKQQWVPNVVTVTTKEAYDETVTTGYVCSECGATK